jgi:arylformamidase
MAHRSIPKLIVAGALCALLPAALPALRAAPLQEPAQSPAAQPEAQLPATGKTEYAYGAAPLQKLDFWHAASSKPAPLILFVHGGGWKRGDKKNATGVPKIDHMLNEGYAFASMNYRLVPAATVEQQAADVVAALAYCRANAARLGIDATRIVLMGHSAGAHLVALVGSTPRYMAEAGLALTDIRGVIALDGAAYDVPRQLADAGRFMRATYVEAFGSDPARQRALSPALQPLAPTQPSAAKPPPFLIAHIDRADGKAQSEALAAALVRGGTQAEVVAFGGTGLRGHMAINRDLGSADYPATAIVDAWLRKLR